MLQCLTGVLAENPRDIVYCVVRRPEGCLLESGGTQGLWIHGIWPHATEVRREGTAILATNLGRWSRKRCLAGLMATPWLHWFVGYGNGFVIELVRMPRMPQWLVTALVMIGRRLVGAKGC